MADSDFQFKGTLNIDALKKKVDEDKLKDKRTNYWKPKPGKNVIRIIPYQHGSSPFNELFFHYMQKETILCPQRTLGRSDCPICKLVGELYKSNLQSDKDLASKIRAKVRYYVPIICRDDKEPKAYFWGFPKQTYEKLVEYCLNEDYGDVSDITNGHDITLTYTEKNATNIFGKSEIILRPKKTPLYDDMDQIKKVYESVPDLSTMYPPLSQEELLAKMNELKEGQDAVDETGSNYAPVANEEDTERHDLEAEIDHIIEKE